MGHHSRQRRERSVSFGRGENDSHSPPEPSRSAARPLEADEDEGHTPEALRFSESRGLHVMLAKGLEWIVHKLAMTMQGWYRW